MADPRIGGAGSAAAVARAVPAPAAAPAPDKMEEGEAVLPTGRNTSTLVDDLIRHLNDEETTRLTFTSHGYYSPAPSSFTLDSYVIETSLYGEIFYVIKIKYISLLFSSSEQLAFLFTQESIHTSIQNYDYIVSILDGGVLDRVYKDNAELKPLLADKPAFIKKLGEYIRDLILKGSWDRLRTYMGDLYTQHLNDLVRLESCLTACTIYPPGSRIYTRVLDIHGQNGREPWAGVHITGPGEASGDRIEEEPFRTLFIRDRATTTRRVVHDVDMHMTPVRDKCIYIFVSCGARASLTDESPHIEERQNEQRKAFNENRDDTSGPEVYELGMQDGVDVDTVKVSTEGGLTLDMAVRTREPALNIIVSKEMTESQVNEHLGATENQANYGKEDTAIRCDATHPIAVLLDEVVPVEALASPEGTDEEDEHYVFHVKVDRVERNTLAILLEDLLDRPLLRYYIKIEHGEGEYGPRSTPSLVPVFPLVQKYLPAGSTAESFLAKVNENSVNKYIYIEWVDRYAEKIFKQEDIGSFYDFVGLFTGLVEVMKVKTEYRNRVLKVYNHIYNLLVIAKKSVKGEAYTDLLQEIIEEARGSQMLLKPALAKFITRLEGEAGALEILLEKVKPVYIPCVDDPEDQIQEAIDELLDEEEGMKETPDTVRGELEPKLREIESFSKELKAIVKRCLPQRGSSRKTRSKKDTPKRKTKKRRLKSCLTRRKSKKADAE